MGPDGTPSSDKMVKYIIIIRNTTILSEKPLHNNNTCQVYVSVRVLEQMCQGIRSYNLQRNALLSCTLKLGKEDTYKLLKQTVQTRCTETQHIISHVSNRFSKHSL
jgi:hypothetical protein